MQAEGPAPDAGLGDVGRRIADDAVKLVRAEIELAKAEALSAAKRVAVAAGLFLAALMLLLLMVIFALAALPERFGAQLLGDSWKGWSVMAALFLLAAGGLAVAGIAILRHVFSEAKETVAVAKSPLTLRENIAWVRQLTRRSKPSS